MRVRKLSGVFAVPEIRIAFSIHLSRVHRSMPAVNLINATPETAMNALIQDLSRQARALPPEDRALLAEELLASLQDDGEQEVDAAWDTEIARRLAQVKNGTATLIPAEEVHAQRRRLYR